jgi:preprotein translocase subunit SecG
MLFIIGLLTVLMVLDSLFLILLVLMQLPKKETGAGLAFGAAATDALFGAGSGNFLTKATKYAAIVFFGFALVISVLQIQFSHREGSEFRRLIEAQPAQAPAPTTPAPVRPAAPSTAPAAAPANTNLPLLTPLEKTAPTNPATPQK